MYVRNWVISCILLKAFQLAVIIITIWRSDIFTFVPDPFWVQTCSSLQQEPLWQVPYMCYICQSQKEHFWFWKGKADGFCSEGCGLQWDELGLLVLMMVITKRAIRKIMLLHPIYQADNKFSALFGNLEREPKEIRNSLHKRPVMFFCWQINYIFS